MSTTKAYHGSCHCGDVQYQVKLTLPPDLTREKIMALQVDTVRIYKCNCSVCQKMGFFHCRPIDPENDFILTSPSSIDELGDYRVNSRKMGWYFCKKCGVRVVGMGGKWEQIELDVEKWAGKEGGEGKTQKVWVTRPDGEVTKVRDGKEAKVPFHYLSINAVTLDVGEGGVDLNEWHEKGWIFYVQNKAEKGIPQLGKPWAEGMY